MFVDQIDLQVTLLGIGAQIVLANQTVEGDGAGGARIGLHVQHFFLLRQIGAQVLQCSGGVFQRRASRHVDHHLELTLVVKGQHLHDDPLHASQSH